MDRRIVLATLIIVLSFICMVAAIIYNEKKAYIKFKMISSLTLVAVAIFYAIFVPFKLCALLPIAMLCGSFGDYFLGKKENDAGEKNGKLLILGFVSFAIGHIFYLVTFIFNFKIALLNIILGFICGLIILIAIYLFQKFNLMDYGKFTYHCAGYGYLLLSIVFVLFFNAIILKTYASIVIFAAMLFFLISDLILMVMYFSPKGKEPTGAKFKFIKVMNLLTYFFAQYVLVNLPFILTIEK